MTFPSIAPAHPHATRVAVYPALFFFFSKVTAVAEKEAGRATAAKWGVKTAAAQDRSS